MCSKNLRDGETTETIPLDQVKCKNDNCSTDSKYGMHEDYDYYKQCKNRQRNHRLFTSTQKLKVFFDKERLSTYFSRGKQQFTQDKIEMVKDMDMSVQKNEITFPTGPRVHGTL